jgi:arylsulfatase A-like enzyme
MDLAPVSTAGWRASGAAAFWEYNTAPKPRTKAGALHRPALQEGTTPLVKLAGGKSTRTFLNYRHPKLTEADMLGPRAIIQDQFKLVLHEETSGGTRRELFDLNADPAERTNLAERQPARVQLLQAKLEAWQKSVLESLTGADYNK